jgi:hypothetical protein
MQKRKDVLYNKINNLIQEVYVSNYEINSCHLERSERSLGDLLQEILRFAQNDKNQIHSYLYCAHRSFKELLHRELAYQCELTL